MYTWFLETETISVYSDSVTWLVILLTHAHLAVYKTLNCLEL